MSSSNEKHDLEAVTLQSETMSNQDELKASNIEFERGQLLAGLPDPDEGKTEEEKKAIDKKLMWKVDLWLVPWLSIL